MVQINQINLIRYLCSRVKALFVDIPIVRVTMFRNFETASTFIIIEIADVL